MAATMKEEERASYDARSVDPEAEKVAALYGILGPGFSDAAESLLREHGGLIDLHTLQGYAGDRVRAALQFTSLALKERAQAGVSMGQPYAVKDYLRLRCLGLEHEVFYVLFLDAQNRLIEAVPMFRGTLTQTSVYPREVVKEALRFNAASVIFAHNHPSGVPEPSRADEALTQSLRQALALVDVRVLDHMVVGADSVMSFAERGLL
jgi:DNA repair protein RadC